MTCLDPKYRIVAQCQNIVYVLYENLVLQPKLGGNLEILTKYHDKSEPQSDIF